MENFINLNNDNIENEHICCIIRKKSKHLGIESKKEWLKEKIKEGHVFRKLNVDDIVFIEYSPLDVAWVPINGDNYYYIYCLWVSNNYRNKGFGKSLIEYCINDAKKNGKSGICMLGSKKQKAWLSDQSFAKKYGFKIIDETKNDYHLLALSFDGNLPKFSKNAKSMKINDKCLTIYYDLQCPYILKNIENINNFCKENNIDIKLIKIDTLKKAKDLPCVFNNYAVFYNGDFITTNLIDINFIKKLVKK